MHRLVAAVAIAAVMSLTGLAQEDSVEKTETQDWLRVTHKGKPFSKRGRLVGHDGGTYWLGFDKAYESYRVYYLQEAEATEVRKPDGAKLMVETSNVTVGDRLLIAEDSREGAVWCLSDGKSSLLMNGEEPLEIGKQSLIAIPGTTVFFQTKAYKRSHSLWEFDGVGVREVEMPDSMEAIEYVLCASGTLIAYGKGQTCVFDGESWERPMLAEEDQLTLHSSELNPVSRLPAVAGSYLFAKDPEQAIEGRTVIRIYEFRDGGVVRLSFPAGIHPVDLDIVEGNAFISAIRSDESGNKRQALLTRGEDGWVDHEEARALLDGSTELVLYGDEGLLFANTENELRPHRFHGSDAIPFTLPGDQKPRVTDFTHSGELLYCLYNPDPRASLFCELCTVTRSGNVTVGLRAEMQGLDVPSWSLHADKSGCYVAGEGFSETYIYYHANKRESD